MKNTKEFFESVDSIRRIDYICNYLSDNKSKEIFKQVIKYRYTYDKNDMPEYNIQD